MSFKKFKVLLLSIITCMFVFCYGQLKINAEVDPYWVVAGSFDNIANVNNMVDKLLALNEKPVIIEVVVSGKQYSRVCVGPFDNRDGAVQKQNYLKQNGIADAWLVTMPIPIDKFNDTSTPGSDVYPVSSSSESEIRIGTYMTTNNTATISVGSDVNLLLKALDSTLKSVEIKGTSFVIKPGTNKNEIIVEYGNNQKVTLLDPVEIGMAETQASPAKKFTWLNDKLHVYRGRFKFTRNSYGGVTAINILYIEDYLRGVLVAEIGADAPVEALCAQAIIARTEVTNKSRHASEGYDFCTGTHCQSYNGATSEYNLSVLDDVTKKTNGIVVYYKGEKISEGKFYACCGGITDNCFEIWGGNVPYLVSTWCMPDKGLLKEDFRDEAKLANFINNPDPNHYCYKANGYRWSKVYTMVELTNVLSTAAKNNGLKEPGALESVNVTKRSQRGAVCELNVVFSGGSITIKSEYSIREALGGTNVIRSGVFVLKMYKDNGVDKCEISGAGFGHGLGLCQNGARQMAKLGLSYSDILSLYFPGTDLRRIN